jgi:hypothetical protein
MQSSRTIKTTTESIAAGYLMPTAIFIVRRALRLANGPSRDGHALRIDLHTPSGLDVHLWGSMYLRWRYSAPPSALALTSHPRR